MKKEILLFFALFVLFWLSDVQAQRFRVAFWNVENMFDTLHDEGKQDEEFLPTAKRQWNSPRYWHKLRGITKTIAAMGENGEMPAIVGMCEVENDSCLRDLTRRTALYNAKYKYIITDSPDQRGVDVALLYQPKVFHLYSWRSARVPSVENGLRPTRDILVASGTLPSGDTLHVCVVHLPSRQNNNEATRQNRMLAVQTLLTVVDSLKENHQNINVDSQKISTTLDSIVSHPWEGMGNVIIMGDFNAEPSDPIFSVLCPPLQSLMPTDKKTLRGKRGSYYFQKVWGFLDHILATPSLATHAVGEAHECRFPFLMRKSYDIPWRTYGGTTYLGGYSDHLPVMVELEYKDNKQFHSPD